MTAQIYCCSVPTQNFVFMQSMSKTLYNNYGAVLLSLNENHMRKLGTRDSRDIEYKFDPERDFDQECKEIEKCLKVNNIDKLYIGSMGQTQGYKFGDDKGFKALLEGKGYTRTFNSVYNTINKLLVPIVADKLGIPVIHIVGDPCQLRMSDYLKNAKCYYILNNSHYGLKYFPLYEHFYYKYFDNIHLSFIEKQKHYKLCFAGIISNSFANNDRTRAYNYFKDLKRDDFMVKFTMVGTAEAKKMEGNKKIPQDEYFKVIKQSDYGIVYAAFDPNTCSIRYFDYIFGGTIPMFSKECNLQDVKDTFPDIYDLIIKYDLIFSDEDELIKKVDSNVGKGFIEEVYKTESMRKIINNELKEAE